MYRALSNGGIKWNLVNKIHLKVSQRRRNVHSLKPRQYVICTSSPMKNLSNTLKICVNVYCIRKCSDPYNDRTLIKVIRHHAMFDRNPFGGFDLLHSGMSKTTKKIHLPYIVYLYYSSSTQTSVITAFMPGGSTRIFIITTNEE